MEKIIHSLIDNWTKGVDTYTHNGSTWLIFTDNKQWVIELTDAKTLWYNYNFFKQIFEFTSMDVVDNQQYITKWVENNIINKVEHTSQSLPRKCSSVEDIIQNGPIDSVRVNEYSLNYVSKQRGCEDTIENGVKETSKVVNHFSISVEDTIENGVKETNSTLRRTLLGVDDIIQNGVKSTISTLRPTLFGVDDIIQDGIKETRLEMNITEGEVDDIIQDGVKETNHIKNNVRETKQFEEHLAITIDDVINEGVIETSHRSLLKRGEIEDIIDDGVKETIELMNELPNRVKKIIKKGVKHTQERIVIKKSIVDDAIEKGIKYTFPNSETGTSDDVESVIKNGVKDTYSLGALEVTEKEINNTLQNGVKYTEYGDWLDGDERFDDIIQNGVRKTLWIATERESLVETTINNGVKETNPVDVMKFFDNKMEDALQNGVNETLRASYLNVDNVIQDGVKKTYHDTDNYTDDVNEVIREGVKETKTPGKDGDILSTIEWMEENKSTSYTKMIDDVIDNGIKEIKTPNKDGDIQSTLEWMYKNNYQDDYNGSKMINNVIENGVKETKSIGKESPNYPIPVISHIIKNGVKVSGTFVGGTRQKENIESVIGYGTKNPTD